MSHDNRSEFQGREGSVAVKSYFEWREVNRWIAEERIDGYGASGDTTRID
jgi:hypothetical protein